MGLNQRNPKTTLKPAAILGRLKETCFIYRHHVESRVRLFVSKEESLPIPLKFFFDVTKTTTNPDVVREKNSSTTIEILMVDRTLSDSWTGFMKFTLSSGRPPGCTWSGDARKRSKQPPDHWHVESSSKAREARMGYSEAKTRQCSKIESVKKPLQKRKKEIGNSFGSCRALHHGDRKRLQEPREIEASGDTHPLKETKCASVVEAHESTRKRFGVYCSEKS